MMTKRGERSELYWGIDVWFEVQICWDQIASVKMFSCCLEGGGSIWQAVQLPSYLALACPFDISKLTSCFNIPLREICNYQFSKVAVLANFLCILYVSHLCCLVLLFLVVSLPILSRYLVLGLWLNYVRVVSMEIGLCFIVYAWNWLVAVAWRYTMGCSRCSRSTG